MKAMPVMLYVPSQATPELRPTVTIVISMQVGGQRLCFLSGTLNGGSWDQRYRKGEKEI